MKKLLALILALVVSITMFAACSSDEYTESIKNQEQISSLDEKFEKDLLKQNNSNAKLIYASISNEIADRVIDASPIFAPGKYFFVLGGNIFNNNSNNSDSQKSLKADHSGGFLSEKDTEKLLKSIISDVLEINDNEKKYCIYIELEDNNSNIDVNIKNVAIAEQLYPIYAGQYPDETKSAPTFNIYDLKE